MSILAQSIAAFQARWYQQPERSVVTGSVTVRRRLWGPLGMQRSAMAANSRRNISLERVQHSASQILSTETRSQWCYDSSHSVGALRTVSNVLMFSSAHVHNFTCYAFCVLFSLRSCNTTYTAHPRFAIGTYAAIWSKSTADTLASSPAVLSYLSAAG